MNKSRAERKPVGHKPNVSVTDAASTAELKSRDTLDLLASIVESSDDAILACTKEGIILTWNRGAQKIFGYSAAEALGQNLSILAVPERSPFAAGIFESIWCGAQAVQREYVNRRRDDEKIHVALTASPMRDQAGVVVAMSLIFRDITEQKRIVEELQENERQLRAVLESAPYAVVVVDDDEAMVLVNAETERIFGHKREDLAGKSVRTLLPLYDRENCPLETSIEMVLVGVRENGVELPVEIGQRPLFGLPKARAILAIRDVTERRTVERGLLALAVRDATERRTVELGLVAAGQRSEDANRSKSAFLAAMSHEIRTPMNAILGMSELLWESNLDSQQREYVEIFRNAGANLLSLLDDILDLSKIESGHFELETDPFNLEDVLDQVTELIGEKSRKKGVALMVRIAPGVWNDFIGDQGRLRQVLFNLVGNAVKFTHRGEIILSVESQKSGGPGNLCFSIIDTGLGIAPDKLKVIFEDFTQADSSITRRHGGTGLGLGISRRIVEKMGGRLTVTSTQGKGSTFQFTASFGICSPKRRQSSIETEDFHGRRVLLIDPSATYRLILQETLDSWGFQSSAYGTSAQALADLADAKQKDPAYSLVILNDHMADSGVEDTAAAIKNIAPKTPVILLGSERISGAGNLRAGIFPCFFALKPVKRADLLRMIYNAMSVNDSNEQKILESAPVPGNGPDLPQSGRTNPIRLLVVDDSRDNRVLIQAYLKGGRYVLTFAEDGRRALEQFSKQAVDSIPFDLILMDTQMPVVDGLTATRAIRKLEREHGHPATPIIALTAHAGPDHIKRSMDAGSNFHLAKPIKKSTLLEAITRHASPAGVPPRDAEPILVDAPEGLEELVPSYLACRRGEIGEIAALLAAGDFERIAILAHDIKGTGQSFGFSALTVLARALEKAAQAADAEATQILLTELDRYLQSIQLLSPDRADLVWSQTF